MQITPQELVDAVRDSFTHSTEIFKNGRCFELHLFLRSFWKDAVPWYDPIVGHVYTQIDGCWFDIDGRHLEIPLKSYVMTRFELEKTHRWARGAVRTSSKLHWGDLDLPPINLLNVPIMINKG